MGYKRGPPPKTLSGGKPGVTPLSVSFFVFGSRAIPCMESWKEIQTSSPLRSHEGDIKDPPSRQPRPSPEDSPISSTFPASKKKTAISRTEAQKIAPAEQQAEKRTEAHQRRAAPKVRYDAHRSSEHAHRTRPNTQRQQHAAV